MLMSDPADIISNRIGEMSRHAAAATHRAKVQAEFSALDCDKITALSDKELAAWQANFGQDTPQWRFAEHSWQSRLLVEQVKVMRFAAYVGVAGTILGGVAGAFLGAYLAKPAVDQQSNQGSKSNGQAHIQNEVLKPEDQPLAPIKPIQSSSVPQQPNAKN